MSNLQKQETTQSLSQKRGVTWASGIFTALSFAFFGLSLYIVFVRQNGRFDLADTVMMSLTVVMFITSLASLILARKNQVNLSAGIIFGVSLVPPIIATLMIKGFAPVSIAFIILLASILIFQILPKTFRRAAVVATVTAVIVTIGIELWNPVFRGYSTVVPNFVAVSITLVVVALLAFSARWAWSGNLRSQLITSFLMVAIVPLVVTMAVVSYRSFSTQTPIALETQSQIAKRVAEQVKNFILAREQELYSLVEVGDLGNVSLEEQTTLLKNLISTQSLYDELILVNKYGREVTYISRLNVVAPEELGSHTGKNEFETPKTTGKTYYGPVAFNDVNGQPYQIIAIPINNLRTGQLAYVLIANFRFKTVWDLMAEADVAGSGSVYMIDDQNRVIAHANPSIALQQKKVNLPTEDSFTTGLSGDRQVAMARENIVLNEQTFSVIAEQPSSEALALPINNLIISIFITLGMALLAGFIGVAIANFITNPIGKLSEAAQSISQGNYSQHVVVNRQNEIGALATAFNSMTAQLSGLIGSLEQRVTDRTKALATSTEVSRRLSTILNQKELVEEVVNQVNNAFGYYHTQIYFLDKSNENLVMAGGTGESGKMMLAQFHKVTKGRGLVGRAAASNEPILVSDTTQNPEWLPNPLLPDTKSEVAIPISIGNEVLGVLDVQHNIVDGLQREDVDALQSIANQVAVALQNIKSTETVAKRAAELQTVANISTAAATINNIEDMLQEVVHLTQRGFGLYHAHVFTYNEDTRALDIVACGYKEGDEHEGTHGTTSIPVEQEQSLVARAGRTRQAVIVNNVRSDPGWLPNPLLPDTASELAVPLIVGGQLLGVLDVQSERLNAFTEEDANIQTTLASQVATAMQNTRSFLQVKKQADRETAVNQVIQKIQGTTSIETALQVAARELGHVLGMKSTLVTLESSTRVDDKKGNQ